MTDGPKGYSATRMLLVIVAALVVIAAVLWQLGMFESGTDEDMREVYTTDVKDESGGELIVSDPNAPGVEDVTLPETAMTPVPPGEEQGEEGEAEPASE